MEIMDFSFIYYPNRGNNKTLTLVAAVGFVLFGRPSKITETDETVGKSGEKFS